MPPAELELGIQTSSPSRSARICGNTAIDAVGAEHVDVILLGELLGRECLGRAEHHVSGIVDDVDPTALGDDLIDGGID